MKLGCCLDMPCPLDLSPEASQRSFPWSEARWDTGGRADHRIVDLQCAPQTVLSIKYKQMSPSR